MPRRGLQQRGIAVVIIGLSLTCNGMIAQAQVAISIDDEVLLLDPIEVSAAPIYSVQYPGDTFCAPSDRPEPGGCRTPTGARVLPASPAMGYQSRRSPPHRYPCCFSICKLNLQSMHSGLN
ncbi:hypothetical protein CCR96_21280 [Halochromatium roseum]|nr:hypothetical protein [Halochromatium roseum]